MTPQQKQPHHTMVLDLAREAGLPTYRFPKTDEEAQKAEDILARDLDKLSLDDQEHILFQTHGLPTVSNDDKETDEFVEKMLQEFDNELDKINKKDAYDQALFMNPLYVRDKKFRLQFLRAVDYDVKDAASRMVNHFDTKRELFGDGEVLAREVRQSDFSEKDLEQLRRGVEQMLPIRDASGRSVLIINPSASAEDLSDLKERKHFVVSKLRFGRSHFYMHTAALRDEAVAKEGVVCVCYAMDCPLLGDFEAFEWINRVDLSVPIAAVVAHICVEDPGLRPLVAGFRLFSERRDRHRMRFHYGSLNEVHFTLQTFGIPIEYSPMQPGEEWSTEYHLQWLEAQRQWEESQDKQQEEGKDAELVIIPRRFDVLFGKCSRARLSTGTQRALHLVDMYQERYEQANKFEKTELAEKIISTIHASDGRFLKQDEKNNGCWIQVDHTDARKKVAHWFRHARSKVKQQSQKQKIEAGTKDAVNSCSGRRRLDELVTDDVEEESRKRAPKRVSIISSCSHSSSDSDETETVLNNGSHSE